MCKSTLTVRNNWHISPLPEDGVNLQQKIRLRPSSLFWDFTRFILAVCYRRSGTNNLSHFQGSLFFDCLALEDRAGKLRRNFGNKQPTTLRKIPEGRVSHLHCGGKLKPRVTSVCLPPDRQRSLRVLSFLAAQHNTYLYKTWLRTARTVVHTAMYNHWRRDRRQNSSTSGNNAKVNTKYNKLTQWIRMPISC